MEHKVSLLDEWNSKKETTEDKSYSFI